MVDVLPDIPFVRDRYLRKVPAVEGDLATRRHWIIVREPGMIPDKKGPFKFDQVDSFLRELIACRPPETHLAVVSLTWDFDVWVEDGRQRIEIDDSLAELTDEDWREIRGELHPAKSNGEA